MLIKWKYYSFCNKLEVRTSISTYKTGLYASKPGDSFEEILKQTSGQVLIAGYKNSTRGIEVLHRLRGQISDRHI